MMKINLALRTNIKNVDVRLPCPDRDQAQSHQDVRANSLGTRSLTHKPLNIHKCIKADGDLGMDYIPSIR